MARLKQNINIKSRLSQTLKGWLPILQSSISELDETLSKISQDNPCLEINSSFKESLNSLSKSKRASKPAKRSISDKIESLSVFNKGLIEVLKEQIVPPLFPTSLSQEVAFLIIDNINEEGYFDCEQNDFKEQLQGLNLDCSFSEAEKIRARFCYLEPSGIGAKDVIECFKFQLYSSDLEDEDYSLALKILNSLKDHAEFKKVSNYEKVMKIIKSFKKPPAIEYLPKELEVIADIIILQENNNIELSLNDSYYPSINIESPSLKQAQDLMFFKTKLKEARDLVDALDMRKSTIRKIGLMIIEYQYDFFMGGEIKPMRLKDLADEFNHSPSTISRAIANKYLECNRGIFPIKSFFTTAIHKDVSNASIKDFVSEIIKEENPKKPLSDIKILELIEQKFELKMVRRTITKYRQQLGILGSSERKKMYKLSLDKT